MIQVSGVAIATPADFQVMIADISKAQRNAQGNMIIERINTKRTLSLSYNFLTQDDCAKILQAVAPVSFSVTYPDPQTGVNRTSNFYCGDRNLGIIDFLGGAPRYKDVKFTLVEL
jgi:hypothetical protein